MGQYVGRRLGREVVDRLVDPLLGGVYAGRADGLSLRATMPAAGGRAGRRGGGKLVSAARSVVDAAPPDAGPVFASLDGGLGMLPEAVARAVRRGRAAAAADPPDRAHRRRLPARRRPGPGPGDDRGGRGRGGRAGGKAAGLLEGLAPWAAHELAAMEYASVGIVTLAFPTAALAGLTRLRAAGADGRGRRRGQGGDVLVAQVAAPGRPRRGDVLRASVGRHREARVLQRDDTELVRLVAGQLAALAGIRAAPVAHRVTRWGGALPQYAPGHLERVRRIRADVAGCRGWRSAAPRSTGSGVPACIRSGTAAAGAGAVEHLRESMRGSGRQAGP